MVTNQRLLEEFRQLQCLEVWKNVILWKNSYANKEKGLDLLVQWYILLYTIFFYCRENWSVSLCHLDSLCLLIKLIKFWLAQLDHFPNGNIVLPHLVLCFQVCRAISYSSLSLILIVDWADIIKSHLADGIN